MLGERVEERVRGRVTRLAGTAEGGRSGGEQDEGGQRQVLGQLVQVRRGVELRPHHPLHPVGGQRAQHAVVEHAGGVHHRGQRVLGRDRGDRRREVIVERGVAGHDGGGGPQPRQFGGEVVRSGRVGALPAEQQQVAYTVPLREVPREQPTQHSRAPGDQDRAVRVEATIGRGLRGGWGAGDPWCEHESSADRELRFHRLDRGRDDRPGRLGVIHVEEGEPARFLGLGGAEEPPEGGGGEVLDVLRPPCRQGAAGQDDEPRSGEPLVGDPFPQQVECLADEPVRRRCHVDTGTAERGDHDVGGGRAPVQG